MSDSSCAYCGTTDGPFQIDHVVPFSRGGRHSPHNLVQACAKCNSAKTDKLPSEWLGDKVPAAVAAIEAYETIRTHLMMRARRGRKPKGHVQSPESYERDPIGTVDHLGHATTGDPFWDDPFERRLDSLNRHRAPASHIEAAVSLRETLETADAIARSVFGKRWTPESSVAVYRELARKDDELRIARAEEAWRAVEDSDG